MNSDIAVSILVPVYNVEKYLPQCLDSLINQTLKNIEIICINDGSTDTSLKILENYQQKDTRIKIIDKENSGYGASMNLGLDAASGEYIGIIESDDFADSTMFESLYKLAKKFDAEIVKSDFFQYTTSNNQSRKSGIIDKNFANKFLNAKNYQNLFKMPPSIWSAIYKNEFIKRNNIRFLETPGASYQDTSFAFITLSLAEKIVLTDKAFLYYRQDNENSSVNSKEKVFLICGEYNKITDFLNHNPEIKKFVNTPKLIKQYSTYLWNLKRIDDKFRDNFIDVFSDTFKKYFNDGEITEKFYKKHDKNLFNLLLNDKELFKKSMEKIIEKENKKMQRRKMFSIRINPSRRISIVLFGKQILEVK